MQNLFSENRMIGLRRAAAPESNERPPMVSDAPAEGKKGLRNHLKKHGMKYLLGLGALLAGGYGLGLAGQNGAFADGGWYQRNMPSWLTTGTRHASAYGTYLTDGIHRGLNFGLTRLNMSPIQAPTDANSSRQIRENIIQGSGPTLPHEIS